jgi:hypothetical protein
VFYLSKVSINYRYLTHLVRLSILCLLASVTTRAEDSPAAPDTRLQAVAEVKKNKVEFQTPKPFTAKYETAYNGIAVSATRSLKKLPNGQHELRFKAASWIATIEEFSQFTWEKAGVLYPQVYEYHRAGLGKDRDAILKFDWENKKVTNNVQNKPWIMDLPEQALDKLSYQIQLRKDLINATPLLSYAVADGGHIKHYRFEKLGEEVLDTPLGKLRTTKIQRIRKDDANRITYLWMATEWNYLLVRIQQREKRGKPYEIILAEAKVDGVTVKGF